MSADGEASREVGDVEAQGLVGKLGVGGLPPRRGEQGLGKLGAQVTCVALFEGDDALSCFCLATDLAFLVGDGNHEGQAVEGLGLPRVGGQELQIEEELEGQDGEDAVGDA